MNRDTPNPDIVAKLYNLDPDTLGDVVLLRRDGSPATPEDIEACQQARLCDLRAVTELARLAMEQADYELDRHLRIRDLLSRYGPAQHEPLPAIYDRMTVEDQAEFDRLGADLGGVLVITPAGNGPT